MTHTQDTNWQAQQARNHGLIDASTYMRDEVTSEVLPFAIDLKATKQLSAEQVLQLDGLATESARIALRSLASLAKIGELDHLGGGLDLHPGPHPDPGDRRLREDRSTPSSTPTPASATTPPWPPSASWTGTLVIDGFRRGLDIAGHVSWVPGRHRAQRRAPGGHGPRRGRPGPGHERASTGRRRLVICHCGDAGWISGQALNGFNGADLHGAPIVFVMHRNGIQLSGTNKQIMDKDPRPIIEALGVEILEIPSLHDTADAVRGLPGGLPGRVQRQADPDLPHRLSSRTTRDGRPGLLRRRCTASLPRSRPSPPKHGVAMDTEIWIPGSLMSYRDVGPMLECVFLVNELPGGAGHHDGHMKGRDLDAVLANPMFTRIGRSRRPRWTPCARRRSKVVTTKARPAPGTPEPGALRRRPGRGASAPGRQDRQPARRQRGRLRRGGQGLSRQRVRGFLRPRTRPPSWPRPAPS